MSKSIAAILGAVGLALERHFAVRDTSLQGSICRRTFFA